MALQNIFREILMDGRMKRLFALILVATSLSADVWDPDGTQEFPETENKVALISIGSNCISAGIVRSCGFRKAAYPFDWILSLDNEGFIQILEDDFAYFLDEEFLVPDSLLLPKAHAESLFHLKYHVEFVHEGDFRSDYFQKIQKLKEKYARRIQRFKDLADYLGEVYFLRCNYIDAETDVHRSFKSSEIVEISNDDSIRMYQALKKRFPKLKFKLVIINQSQPYDGQLLIEESLNTDIIKTRIRTTGGPLFEAYSQFFYNLLGSYETQ